MNLGLDVIVRFKRATDSHMISVPSVGFAGMYRSDY